MAELVDALVLGTSVNDVGVRVPSSAPVWMFLWDLAFHKNIFLFYADNDNLGAYFTFTLFLVFTVTSTSGILGRSGISIAPIQFQ